MNIPKSKLQGEWQVKGSVSRQELPLLTFYRLHLSLREIEKRNLSAGQIPPRIIQIHLENLIVLVTN